MRIIEDAAAEISVAEHADSPLLLRLWRQICLDRGWRAPHEVGPDARSKFLATLPAELCCSKKFDEAAASRWFSWEKAHDQKDMYHHTLLYAMIYAGVKQGWLTSADDVWKPKVQPSNVGDLVVASLDCAKDVVVLFVSCPSGAASSSSGCAPVAALEAAVAAKGVSAGDAVEGKATRHARGRLAPKAQGFANTFHACCYHMADQDLLHGRRIASLAFQAEALAHAETIKQLRSPESTMALYVN